MKVQSPEVNWTVHREQLLAAQSEALARRVRGVIKEELASLRRGIGVRTYAPASRDEMRAVVTTHAERAGDLFEEFLVRAALSGYQGGQAYVGDAEAELSDTHIARIRHRARNLAGTFRSHRQHTVETALGALEYGGQMARLNALAVLTSEYDQHMKLASVVSRTEVAVAHQLGGIAAWVGVGVTELRYVVMPGCETELCEDDPSVVHPSFLADGEPVVDGLMPPFHPGCRCFCLPI